MGTANISNIGKTMVQGHPMSVSPELREQNRKISFLDLMNRMTPGPETELFPQKENNVGDGKSVSGNAQTSCDNCKYAYRENGIKTQTAENMSRQNVAEKLSGYEEAVKEVLKEELGVTDEELEEAMGTLGILYADLMNPNVLAELVMKLADVQNVSELLCSAEFMTTMQDVAELTQELLNELGVSMEELTQMLQEMPQDFDTALENAVDMSDDTDTTGMANVVEQQTTEADEMQGAQLQTAENPKTTDAANVSDVKPEQTEDALQPADMEVSEEKTAAKANNTVGEPEQKEMQSAEQEETLSGQETSGETMQVKNGRMSGDDQQQNGAGQETMLGGQKAEAFQVQGMETPETARGTVDVSSIIRQITEHAKVTVGNAATTMEMQLAPEHLGKLYLEITARAGSVSAHITAQNEVVKEALEAQLVTLKESMEQAGVKVDAVEVTVESHEFERNLEQNAKQEERQAEEQEKAVKQTRHINLNDLDELSGIMTEEENLVAQMMAEQGNSVDYTA